ncbi:FecR family protein [Novosphingobium sp. CF614]|uniref:FecR family protein n=1 Tax=Novosphingobium sp. CF614 TaxID=1884364 RepID=UPI0008DF81B9|nr:FecR domain-containing protein [Novosphingobium sp. CF614]SFG04374.1 FecR family protein [Novosphingobium sp. CF614]
MGHDVEQVRARAIEWHVRLRDGEAGDWEEFSAWLAEDPRHGEAYDLVEAADLAIEPLLPHVVFREAANDDDIRRGGASARRRWVVGGSLLMASLAAVMILLPRFAADGYEVRTIAGQQRVVTLDAQTRVVLNGATTMRFDRNDPRFASLVEGEALFHVRHDEAHPFTLQVGGNRVQDVGTVFNVVKTRDGIRVAVSEGKVLYNPDAESVALGAGQALVDAAADSEVRVEPVPADAVGAWQQGRFVYTGQPLSQVAADLERSLGIRIAVDHAIAGRAVSGSIALDGDGREAMQIERLEHALDVAITAGTDGWIMKPAAGAQR